MKIKELLLLLLLLFRYFVKEQELHNLQQRLSACYISAYGRIERLFSIGNLILMPRRCCF